MQVFRRVLWDPNELRSWFPPELRVGLLFLPQVVDLNMGEEVCLWLQFPNYNTELYLYGMVAFRRVQPPPKNPTLPVGTGLALRPGQAAEMGFLQRLLTGGVSPLPARSSHRTPVLTPWNCTIVVPQLRMWSAATLTDISTGGARIEAETLPVEQGQIVQVGLAGQPGTTHHLQVAWFRPHGERLQMGLFRYEPQHQQREWSALVDAAVNYLESKLKQR